MGTYGGQGLAGWIPVVVKASLDGYLWYGQSAGGLNCLEVLEKGNLEKHLCPTYLKVSYFPCNCMILYFQSIYKIFFLKLVRFTDFGSTYILFFKFIHRIIFVRIYFICLIRWPPFFSYGVGVDKQSTPGDNLRFVCLFFCYFITNVSHGTKVLLL